MNWRNHLRALISQELQSWLSERQLSPQTHLNELPEADALALYNRVEALPEPRSSYAVSVWREELSRLWIQLGLTHLD